MPTTIRRVLGYARVSSAEQAFGTSLEDQQNAIRAYAKARGLKVDRMYVEAESAVYEKAERRVQVLALLADVRPGDLVLVDKIDRWSRDIEFTFRSVRQILERGANLYAIGEGIDPSTPEGDSMLGLRALFAREEHKRLKVRLVGTRKILRDQGLYVEGLPPWGYRRQIIERGGDRRAKNVLLVDEEAAALVRRAFRLCIEGSSLVEIAAELGVNRDRVLDALKCRVYLGETKDNAGNWIKGPHAPIIDARTFASAQAALERRRKGMRRGVADSETADWWLRDVAHCLHCGAKMSAAYAGTHEARRYYFLCFKRCTRRYVPVRWAEEKCEPMVEDRLVELREIISTGEDECDAAPAVNVEARIAALNTKRSRYVEAYADGALTREQLRERMAKLDDERTRLEAMNVAPRALSKDEQARTLRHLHVMLHAWRKAKPEERRRLVNALAYTILLATGVTPKPEWLSADDLALMN